MIVAAYIGLITATVLTAFGQVLYKKASIINTGSFLRKLLNRYFILGSIIFLICPVLSYFVLKKIDFSIFYAFTSLNYIYVIILAAFQLNEKIDRMKISGVIFIILGLTLYNAKI